ncbi:hypothetical protein [Roseateles amylovorans]|uniref:Uncharacterized protein n=1 Tax=Roseateles amylovorans TaxID=2978473 RepID=A0ABY6ASK6_9BURK|nr:hypothetical protein [Roseateles amylovorans]UXH76214.1 hypothetical protein N4261_14165 [Roseateles amylovorans]
MSTTTNQAKAEFAHDLQVGLARSSVPEFGELPLVGMAGKLAVNIRGLGAIQGDVLRQVADHFFDIPALALRPVLDILAEIGYVDLITTGKTITSVIPNIPHFSSVYSGLGEYVGTIALTEHEEVAIAVLNELRSKPEKRDAMIGRLGAPMPVFNRVELITKTGGLVLPKRARGQDVLVSPYYFADSLDALASQAASGGASGVQRLLDLLKKAQGWPLSMIRARGEINGTKLSSSELQLLEEMVADGVLRPPSLRNPSVDEHFVFTPRPGAGVMDGSKREIYERTMAIVAAVRKGQLLPSQYAIKYPVALLEKLATYKKIGASTEAALQYTNLVTLRVGRLAPLPRSGWYEFQLIDTPENVQALQDAISIFRSGEPLSGGVSDDARIALQRDETYIQSIVASTALRQVARPPLDAQARAEMEQLLLDLR